MQRFNLIFLFLFSFALGALIWGIGFIFLEKKPLFFVNVNNNYTFFKINLTPLFFENQIINNHLNGINLNFLTLKAVYKNKNNGFIVLNSKKKTIFLDLYKTYKGYKLIYIGNNFAILNKNGKNFKITFKPNKNNNSINQTENKSVVKVIKKSTFEKYKNHLYEIWKNIGIIKVNEGYKITYIRKNSVFEKIGLKRGDIILEVNGKKLNNDSDAWKIYENADKIDNFEIKIKRKNQIKVLDYEVY